MDFRNLTDEWSKLRPQIKFARILSYYRVLIKEKSSMALCPFHDDHNPSMHIDEAAGLYHCFSCGASGDAVGFVQRKENCDFLQAVEKACDICGLTFSLNVNRQDPEHERLYKINDRLCQYFQRELLGESRILNYLKKRHINLDQIRKYRIGYAPLSTESESIKNPMQTRDPLNHFAGRVIFPIMNAEGKVLGFGGRSLDPNCKNKYVNSAESPIFRKKELLYGLQNLGSDKNKPIYLVEGYFDALKLQELGYRAAALMGTSCSASAFKALYSKTNSIILALDRDQAGEAALENIINQVVLPWLHKKTKVYVAMYREKDPGDSADCSKFNHKIVGLGQYCQFYLERRYQDNPLALEEFQKLSKRIPDPDARKDFCSQWEKNYYGKKTSREKIKHAIADRYLNNDREKYYIECVQNFPDILQDVDKILKTHYVNPDLDEYLDDLYNKLLALAESQEKPEKKQIASIEKYHTILNLLKNLIIKDCINFLSQETKENYPEEKPNLKLKTLTDLAKIGRIH